ncbi:MAG TPA: SDR family oxidoreductase [Candidatus Bathyarchaeia archaeon]|nr:SDR family oxidoreductase [Candidatus Bathyarchaeia archaeon]
MARLDGKVTAVTGGASGIGEATARLFAEEGAQVAIADVDVARGRQVADEIRARGGRALFLETHTEREAECVAFIEAAAGALGRLDVLVNNAGMRLYQTVVEASAESWDAILGVNVKGYAFCAKAAIPAMRRGGGGSIVNVASIRSVVAGGNMVQYDTTKAAVAGLTRAMALDHAADRIRVNAVCPGPIFTRFHERRATTAGKSFEEFRAEFGRGTMLKRPGTPAEVAACILFLASDDSSYVTGTSLYVDGGQTAL